MSADGVAGVLDEGDDSFNSAAIDHLANAPRRKRRHLRSSDKSRIKVRDFITEAVLGPKKNDEEVGDDFFDVKEERGKGRIGVRVLAAAGTIKRKIYQNGSKRELEVTGAGGTPLVVVQELPGEEHEDRGTASSSAPPLSSPYYGTPSFSTSPTSSLESLGQSVLTSTPTNTSTTNSPPTFAVPLGVPSSQASSTTDENTMSRAPSRTLTIDDSNLKPPKRRHHRHPHAPNALALAKRAHRAFRGDATITDMGEALEDELLHAGFLATEKEKHVVDVILVVFGLLKFAANALVAVDPGPWSDSTLRDSPYTPESHPLPTPAWEWDHDQWMVDMGLDTDESGWQYAWRFRSGHWRGEAQGWRSYVRRRRWIRGRTYYPPPLLLLGLSAENDPADPSSGGIDWTAFLRDSEFASATTPSDGHAVEASEDNEMEAPSLPDSIPASRSSSLIAGLKTATALLPISHQLKDDVFGWDGALDTHDPFLAWSFIKSQGSLLLSQPREKGRSDEALLGLWRSSVITINYHRVTRVFSHCRVDREKLALWRWWLGVSVEESEKEESVALFMDGFKGDTDRCGTTVVDVRELAPNSRPEEVVDVKSWGPDAKRPEMEDVWDLLEARLDHLLRNFEFQNTRLHLLRLILSLHPVAHAHHRYTQWDGKAPFEPETLSPKLLGSRLGRRMDFYTDVKDLQSFYEGKVKEVEGKGKGRA
ncbi:hypothetical protein P7C70_g7359, partial [Phenoliferia sp. Uapishka_3]